MLQIRQSQLPSRLVALAVLCALFILLIGGRTRALFAQSGNPIQIENQNPGTSSWLITNTANNHEIEGYASLTSVNAGSQISFFVNTIDPQYTMTIYRLGYYGGLGGRQMTQPVTLSGIAQPIPTPDPTYGTVECQWTDPYVFTVPGNWVSGVYVVKLVGSQSGKQRYITFDVRNDNRVSDLIFQSSVSTYQAYNAWGGKSLYAYNSTNGVDAVKVSFNRPYDDGQGSGNLLSWELDMVAFLEQEGYDVVYTTSVDTHESPSQLLLHKGFLSVGHDEYWSYEMRTNVTAARDQGVNLGFFSADTSNWQIRYEPSPITGDVDRTQVGYKEQWMIDPDTANPATYYLITANWGQTRFTYPGHPEDAFIGAMYNGAEPTDGDIIVTDASNWVFANTGLTNGGAITGLLGYEASAEEGNQPANTILLAHSPYTAPNGSTAYGDMTLYQAASGATVFSASTVQWSWGLSNLSPWGPTSSQVNAAAQQITSNVLAEFINSSPTPTPNATGTAISTATPTPAPSVIGTPVATPTSSVVQITTPANGATVSGTIAIAVTRASGVSWVNVYIDGNYFASTPPSSFNWDTTTVSNGSHTILAKGFNSGGTVLGTTSIAVTVQNGGATATPTPIATPAPTSTVIKTGTPTPTPAPTIAQTATASPTAKATPAQTATVVPTAVATATPVSTIAPTHTPLPTLAMTPTATRTATPSRTPTPTRTPTPQATPTSASVQITAPSNGATVAGTVSITVVKGTGVSWANIYIDGVYFASTPPTTLSWNSKTVADGAHTISAKAFNSGGTQLGSVSITVTVAN
jgi:hypothetical protein